MPTVADVLRQYGDAYLERFGAAMPAEHKKVLRAISACRTGQLGTVVYQCASCGTTHAMGRSCGNRHCPTCQQDKTKAWLETQIDRLLPCPYFLLTFTVPAALRDWMRSHPRVAYAALFEASRAAITTLASNPKYVGSSRCGFFGVLHTWGRTLEYHPHVHYVVPGGGISDDGRWLPSRPDFFVPVRALSILFRAKFRAALERAGRLSEVDPSVWRHAWVVHSQAAGDGQASLKDLAPYVFRVALSDQRIVSCEDGQVTFSYRKSGSNRPRRMTLDAFEFIRRFLQHVLPGGFQKIRHYGFLSPNSTASIEAVRWLVTLYYGLVFVLRDDRAAATRRPSPLRCPACGGPMHVIGFLPSVPALVFDTSWRATRATLELPRHPRSPSRPRSGMRVRAERAARVSTVRTTGNRPERRGKTGADGVVPTPGPSPRHLGCPSGRGSQAARREPLPYNKGADRSTGLLEPRI